MGDGFRPSLVHPTKWNGCHEFATVVNMIFELSERRLKKKNSIIFCGLSIRRGRGVVRVACVRGYRCFSAQKLGRRDKVPRVATERRFCPGFCHVLEPMNCHAPLFVTVWVTDKASLFSREASQANIIISEKDGGNDLSFSLCFCTVGLAKRFGPTKQGHK